MTDLIGLFTNTHTCCQHNERETWIMNEGWPSSLRTIASSLCGEQKRVFVNKTRTDSLWPFYYSIWVHCIARCDTWLNEHEANKNFKLKKNISLKWRSANRIKMKSQEELLKINAKRIVFRSKERSIQWNLPKAETWTVKENLSEVNYLISEFIRIPLGKKFNILKTSSFLSK